MYHRPKLSLVTGMLWTKPVVSGMQIENSMYDICNGI